MKANIALVLVLAFGSVAFAGARQDFETATKQAEALTAFENAGGNRIARLLEKQGIKGKVDLETGDHTSEKMTAETTNYNVEGVSFFASNGKLACRIFLSDKQSQFQPGYDDTISCLPLR